MADNVAITAGSGTNIASDDIAGIQHQRVKVEYGADGSATDVSATTPLPMTTPSVISTNNSSTATLGGSAAFTGTSDEVVDFAEARVSVIADVASATDGLSIQQSSNGTNWDFTDVFTLAAATGRVFSIGIVARYLRVVYTNGAGAQASFRLQTVYHRSRTKPSAQRPSDARTNEIDTEEVSAFTSLFDGTNWRRSRSDTAGVQYVVAGHPDVQTIRLQFTAAQTNAAIVSVSTGTRIVVTALQVTLDNASTVFPSVRIGFGTASTPTTTGVIAAHGGVPAGGGFSRGDGSGILGIGADDEDLRITTVGAATGNGVEVVVTFYTISP